VGVRDGRKARGRRAIHAGHVAGRRWHAWRDAETRGVGITGWEVRGTIVVGLGHGAWEGEGGSGGEGIVGSWRVGDSRGWGDVRALVLLVVLLVRGLMLVLGCVLWGELVVRICPWWRRDLLVEACVTRHSIRESLVL